MKSSDSKGDVLESQAESRPGPRLAVKPTFSLSSSPLTSLHRYSLSCSPTQVGKKSIINKLFFDLAQEEETVLDAEFLKVPRIDLILLNSKPFRSSLFTST